MLSKIEKLLSLKISLRIFLLIFILFTLFSIFFSGVVRHTVIGGSKFGKFGIFAESVSKFTRDVSIVLDRGLNRYLNNMTVVPIKNKIDEISDLKIFNKDKFTGGYLVFSGFSPDHQANIIHLYDLNKKKYIWKWVPDPAEILKNEPLLDTAKGKYTLNIGWNADDMEYSRKIFQPMHPLLMKDGSIIFHPGAGAPLVKLSACSNIEWINYNFFHHSIEKINDDKIIATITTKTNEKNDIGKFFKDDGYAIVDTKNGEILKEESIINILIENDYEYLVLGRPMGNNIIHLNDSQPILVNDNYVNQGDIAFSSRHLSTVFLYRPNDKKIIWLKSGPWIAQHDIDYLGDGIFSLFGNNNYLNMPGFKFSNNNSKDKNRSKLYFFDTKNNKVTTPFERPMNSVYFNRRANGTQRVIDKNKLFLDIDVSLFFMDEDEIIWKFDKRVESNNKSLFRWSSYFSDKEINLDWMNKTKCE
jgi:hypothetical protein